MYNFLIFFALFVAVGAFMSCIYAHVRIWRLKDSTKDLDWSLLSNITGDLATVKKTIQTLNNRLNGMHSPKIADEEIMRYMANKRVANAPVQNTNNKIIGG